MIHRVDLAKRRALARARAGGFGLGFSGGFGGVPAFDPATLSLTGWWRANYSAASTWVGVASAGSSGSNDLTQSGSVSAGTAQNGYTPADFDNTDDQFTLDDTLDTYMGGTSNAGWILMLADTTGAELLGDVTNDKFHLSIDATNVILDIEDSGGAPNTAPTRAYSTGSYFCLTWRMDGSNVQVGVNENPGASGGASSVSRTVGAMSLTGTVRISPSTSGGRFDGRILDMGIADSALNDATFTDIRAYLSARYNLSV